MSWFDLLVVKAHLMREWLLTLLIPAFFLCLGIAIYVTWKARRGVARHR